jgi:hypothetical protein
LLLYLAQRKCQLPAAGLRLYTCSNGDTSDQIPSHWRCRMVTANVSRTPAPEITKRSSGSCSSSCSPSRLSRPLRIDSAQNALRHRNRIRNRCLERRRGPAVPIRQLPSSQNACSDQQDSFASLVHGGMVALSCFIRHEPFCSPREFCRLFVRRVATGGLRNSRRATRDRASQVGAPVVFQPKILLARAPGPPAPPVDLSHLVQSRTRPLGLL